MSLDRPIEMKIPMDIIPTQAELVAGLLPFRGNGQYA
jgi:hypothetical protein